MTLRRSGTSWYPLRATLQWRLPDPGQLLAWDHAVWRVLDVLDRAQADWTDDTLTAWQEQGMPDPATWDQRPVSVGLEWVGGKRPEAMRGDRGTLLSRGGRLTTWHVYDSGRWPQCSCCGEPMPCQAELQDRVADAAMARLDRMQAHLPGHCWGCGEPVTRRQQAVVYAGMNLDLPGGPVVVFHTRRACAVVAMQYEERWLRAEPGQERERILTWPRCPGVLVVHQDGTSECYGGLDTCLGARTHDHGNRTACYAQSRGCGRECGREGHPGCTATDRVPRRQRAVGQL